MKDFLQQIISRLPLYGSELIGLLSGPKQFVAAQNLSLRNTATDAFVFLGISIVIALVAQIPMLPASTELLKFSALAIQAVIGFVIVVVVLYLSWKIVGGKLGFKQYVIVSCYYSGVAALFGAVFTLVTAGIIRSIDPAIYEQLYSGNVASGGLSGAALSASGLLLVAFLGVSLIWLYCVWGTYRELNGLSKPKSAVAFAVFSAAAPLLVLLQGLMLAAVLPGKPVVARSFPADLVGEWQLKSSIKSNDLLRTEIESYRFEDNGTYIFVATHGLTDGRCTQTIQYGGFGRVTAEDAVLSLTPQKRQESTEDSCARGKSTIEKELTVEVYHYELRRHPWGWELCLDGRFGQRCFKPSER